MFILQLTEYWEKNLYALIFLLICSHKQLIKMLSRLCYKQAAVLSQTLKCSSKKISTLRTPLDIFTNKLQFKILNRSLATKSVDAKLKNDIQVQVYYGALTPQIRMVKIFSLATSVTGLMFQPILLQKTDVIGGLPAVI